MSFIEIIAAKEQGLVASILARVGFNHPMIASPKQSDSFAFDRVGLPATGRYHTYY